MNITLLVDDREKKIFPELKTVFLEANTFKASGCISYDIRRLETADYIIESDGNILAAIERKTLKDYAASIKDGRHENKGNLVKLGCKIYYIVEGAFEPQYSTQYEGMNYSSILSSIRRLEIIDNIHVIRTSSGLKTMQQLRFLCEVFSRMDAPAILGTSEAIAASRPDEDTVASQQIIAVWKSLPGISAVSGMELASEYSLGDLVNGITVTHIRGRKATVRQLESLANFDECKLLGKFPGVTDNTAFLLLQHHPLAEILDPANAEAISNIIIGKKRFGVKINRIQALAWKILMK